MGGRRWRMHDLVRLYAQGVAAEALSVEERRAIQERVAAYYVERLGAVAELAEGARNRQIDPARLERQLLWLDRERPTLLGLVEQLAAEHVSLLAELLLDLAVVAADGLTSWPEMPRLSQVMLEVAQQENNARLEAWALYHQALDLLRRGATEKALELLGRAWSLATQTSDQGLRDRLGHARYAARGAQQPLSVAEPRRRPLVADGPLKRPGNTDGAVPARASEGPTAPTVVADAAGLPPQEANPKPVSGTAPTPGRRPATEKSPNQRAATERLDRWAIMPPRSPNGPMAPPSRQGPSHDPSSFSGPESGPGPSGYTGPSDGPGRPGPSGYTRPSGGPSPSSDPGGPVPSGGPRPSDRPGPSGHPDPQRGGHGTHHRRSRPSEPGWEPQPAAASQRPAPRASRVRQATETVRGAGAAPSTPMIFG
jgi:hypothetical protein